MHVHNTKETQICPKRQKSSMDGQGPCCRWEREEDTVNAEGLGDCKFLQQHRLQTASPEKVNSIRRNTTKKEKLEMMKGRETTPFRTYEILQELKGKLQEVLSGWRSSSRKNKTYIYICLFFIYIYIKNGLNTGEPLSSVMSDASAEVRTLQRSHWRIRHHTM